MEGRHEGYLKIAQRRGWEGGAEPVIAGQGLVIAGQGPVQRQSFPYGYDYEFRYAADYAHACAHAYGCTLL